MVAPEMGNVGIKDHTQKVRDDRDMFHYSGVARDGKSSRRLHGQAVNQITYLVGHRTLFFPQEVLVKLP